MKRISVFCILLATLMVTLWPREKTSPEIDIVKLKMSAVKRATAPVAAPVSFRSMAQATPQNFAAVEERISEDASSVALVADEEYEETEEDAPESDEIPWDDIKAGWKSHLQELLVELDPESGEEIFSAYATEVSNHETFIEQVKNQAGDRLDQEIGELENRHEEKLKEIFGKHYQEVTDHHQQYNSSLQYLNRSAKYQVGVSL